MLFQIVAVNYENVGAEAEKVALCRKDLPETLLNVS
jgi:hypothetical protein